MALLESSKQYLEMFKTYLIVEKNFSEHTLKAYTSDLLTFLIWLKDIPCTSVNYTKLREYLYFIQKFDYKNFVINHNQGSYSKTSSSFLTNIVGSLRISFILRPLSISFI